MRVEHAAPVVAIHDLPQALEHYAGHGFHLVAACPEVFPAPGTNASEPPTMLHGYRLFFLKLGTPSQDDFKDVGKLMEGMLKSMNIPGLGPGFDPKSAKSQGSGPA